MQGGQQEGFQTATRSAAASRAACIASTGSQRRSSVAGAGGAAAAQSCAVSSASPAFAQSTCSHFGAQALQEESCCYRLCSASSQQQHNAQNILLETQRTCSGKHSCSAFHTACLLVHVRGCWAWHGRRSCALRAAPPALLVRHACTRECTPDASACSSSTVAAICGRLLAASLLIGNFDAARHACMRPGHRGPIQVARPRWDALALGDAGALAHSSQ